MAVLAAAHVRRFGLTPKIALLSHSDFGSYDSALGAQDAHAADAAAREPSRTRGRWRDARRHRAVSPRSASTVLPNSRLKGDANVLIMPNLDAANIAYQMTKVLADALRGGADPDRTGASGAYPDAVGDRARRHQHDGARGGGGAGGRAGLTYAFRFRAARRDGSVRRREADDRRAAPVPRVRDAVASPLEPGQCFAEKHRQSSGGTVSRRRSMVLMGSSFETKADIERNGIDLLRQPPKCRGLRHSFRRSRFCGHDSQQQTCDRGGCARRSGARQHARVPWSMAAPSPPANCRRSRGYAADRERTSGAHGGCGPADGREPGAASLFSIGVAGSGDDARKHDGGRRIRRRIGRIGPADESLRLRAHLLRSSRRPAGGGYCRCPDRRRPSFADTRCRRSDAERSRFFEKLGIDLSGRSNRPFCRPCLDWSERRYHLAGTLGTRLMHHCLEAGLAPPQGRKPRGRHHPARCAQVSRRFRIATGSLICAVRRR